MMVAAGTIETHEEADHTPSLSGSDSSDSDWQLARSLRTTRATISFSMHRAASRTDRVL
jgi:hypothetical protein